MVVQIVASKFYEVLDTCQLRKADLWNQIFFLVKNQAPIQQTQGNTRQTIWRRTPQSSGNIAQPIKVPVPTPPVLRPKIGGDLTPEQTVRKTIVSLLNKLTATNSETIINSITKLDPIYIPIYVSTIWDFMQRGREYHSLLINALKQFNNTVVKNEIKTLYTIWIDNDEPPALQGEYDEFCDYVKWKTRRVNASIALVQIINAGLLDISLIEYVKTIISKVDCDTELKVESTVEQLLDITDLVSPMQKIAIRNSIITGLQAITFVITPRCKFKIYDLYEKYGIKK